HHDSLQQVAGVTFKVSHLLRVHHMPDFYAGDRVGLASEPGRVRADALPVRVSHHDRLANTLRAVKRGHTRVLVKPDTSTVTVGGHPARSDVVELWELLDVVLLEVKQLIEVEHVSSRQRRCVLLHVDMSPLVVVAFVDSHGSVVHLSERLEKISLAPGSVIEH